MKTQDENRTSRSNGNGEANGQGLRGTLRTRSAAPVEAAPIDEPAAEEMSVAPIEVAGNGHSNGYNEMNSASTVAV